MTYTFRRKLMYANKSPRRIDRKAGGRSKKVNVGQLRSKNEKSIKWKNQRRSSSSLKKKYVKFPKRLKQQRKTVSEQSQNELEHIITAPINSPMPDE